MSNSEQLLSCPNVGRQAKRGCTDIWGIVLFSVASILMMVTATTAFGKGDINRFLYGTDFAGNVCGHGSVNGVSDWSARSLLWYPITYDSSAHIFRITTALKLGVCVASCPRSGDVVPTYGNTSNLPASYTAMFSSSSTLHRCLPTFSSFNCNNDTSCESSRKDENGAVSNALGMNNFFFGIVNEFTRGWWILLLLCVLVVVLCFGWLFALRRLVKPVVFGGILLLFVVAIIVCSVSFGLYRKYQNDPDSKGGEASQTMLAVGIISVVLTLVYAAVVVFFWKSINVACDIIEESSKVIVAIPTVMVTPIWGSVNVLINIIIATFAALCLYTATDKVTTYVGNIQVVEFKTQGWVLPAQLYVIFYTLWNLAFICATAYLIISMVAVQWFFASPGDDKQIPPDPVKWSFRNSLRHVGTVAGGSLLVALCQFARVLLNMFEKQLRNTAGNNGAFKIIFCCANCILGCFERIIKFLTEHAYVMTAIEGDNLITGARAAIDLLTTRGSMLLVNIIAEGIITMGKLAITLVVTLIAFACFYGHAEEGAKQNIIGCVLVVGLGAYFIASVFASVFSVCIDTVLLCYCYDMRHHNGADRPYFSPSDLQKHIEIRTNVAKPLAQEAVSAEGGYSTV